MHWSDKFVSAVAFAIGAGVRKSKKFANATRTMTADAPSRNLAETPTGRGAARTRIDVLVVFVVVFSPSWLFASALAAGHPRGASTEGRTSEGRNVAAQAVGTSRQ